MKNYKTIKSQEINAISIRFYNFYIYYERLIYDYYTIHYCFIEFPSNEFIFIGNGNMIFHKDLVQFSNKLVYKTGIRRSTIELL